MEKGVEKHACTMYAWTALVFVQMKTSSDKCDRAIVCWQLDLWYVILNGAVEISHQEGRVEVLCMGNSFGISPSLDKQYMNGEVRTKGDDCQVKSQHNSSKCSGVGL